MDSVLYVVCYTAVFSVVTQRSSPVTWLKIGDGRHTTPALSRNGQVWLCTKKVANSFTAVVHLTIIFSPITSI